MGKLFGEKQREIVGFDQCPGQRLEPQRLGHSFQTLGMGTAMVGQFAPLTLQYLGQQGVGGSLLQSLDALGTTPAVVPRS
ncbi:DUF2780 domain-containing protein [Pseudomonas fulva]|nr:DUF2780 domain-containing protein [Pseudomonas fulva]MBF8695270.1 DUF2780 domain-containing protein [Pseudomonas fulva]